MKKEPPIDLRSDTVTKPTPAMLEAMFAAEVGDDVFGEDPTVRRLEEKAARLFGKEASLFCPSGTMANQIALRIHTELQDEVICDKLAHIYYYEAGGPAANAGVSLRMLEGDRGRLTPEMVLQHINDPGNYHLPRTRLVWLENTSNKGGGSYYRLNEMAAVTDVAKTQGLRTHLDGARIFNAITETGDSPVAIGACFDSLTFCLSKGLGAPIGSMLVGSREDMVRAKRIRKVFGGNLRQSGYLAAAGIHALDHHVTRLRDDHARARRIAVALHAAGYVEELLPVDTNILVFRLVPTLPVEAFLHRLEEQGIRAIRFGEQTVRMVTHLDIQDWMVDRVVETLGKF
jgi:threonine aldolase